jgi:tRNA wybutosine-synthesizing protein 2
MRNFFHQIKTLLKNEIPNRLLEFLPRGYQKVGDILILNLNDNVLPYKELISRSLLKIIPNTRTICLKKGGITGRYRIPNLEVIGGDNNTETIHIENNCLFKLDVRRIMFSKGNISERRRLANLVENNEIIIDMFAGIGYFSINIARHANPKKVISIEINPVSYSYLLENIRINKLENKIEPINGDCKTICYEKSHIADRIIMGLLPAPKDYIPAALNALKNFGTIHYEGIVNQKDGYESLLKDFLSTSNLSEENIELLRYKKIKSYGPKKDHYRIDVRILRQ